jgi:hypothetical protein
MNTDTLQKFQELFNSIEQTIKDYPTIGKIAKTDNKPNSDSFLDFYDGIMNLGKAERNKWERIAIADFRQYLEDRDLIKKVHSAPGRYAEISGKVWFGSAEYDFSFLKINGKEFTFYNIYDDHLTIEIHVTRDNPTAKILLLK